MKPTLYKPAVFGCALLWLLACSLQAEVRVPVAHDLQQDGRQAQSRQLPIMLTFSADDCSYCELLEEDFLQPMLLSGEYGDRAIIRKLILDDGAHKAVAERGKSLLPSGIRQLDGTFERGDAVRLCDLNGKEFAKGVTNYNSAELIRIIGKNTREILQILGYQYGDEVVHRDNLVISN